MKTINASLKFQLTLLIVCLVSSVVTAQYVIDIQMVPIASGFSKAVDIVSTGMDDRLFIVEQDGQIRIMDTAGNVLPTPFLNIDPIVNSTANERGLLGMTFHPDYASNGYFYVNYTDLAGTTVISRWSVDSSDPDLADATSEEIILSVSQPYWNHNAGDIEFGPDGYLYIPLGDGGAGGDPENRSQDPLELLGKVLRIDVDGALPYTIPADNPFVATTDTLDEIWSLGWRNPWRFSFDSTGNMWVADVGQDNFEEIHVEAAGSVGGGNYGWRCYEGDAPFNLTGCAAVSAYIPSTFVYSHTVGQSVTGGFVYEGNAYPGMKGQYIFCDFISGEYWATAQNHCDATFSTEAIGAHEDGVSTFGEDSYGELFAASLYTGEIFRVEDACAQYPIPELGFDTTGLYVNSIAGASIQWYENCVPVSGATDTLFADPLLDTYYNAVITYADGCMRQTAYDMVVAPPSGVEDVQSEIAMDLFPNPNAGVFNLTYSTDAQIEKGEVLVVDLLGRVLFSQPLSPGRSGNLTFELTDLSAGVYQVILRGENQSAYRSLLID